MLLKKYKKIFTIRSANRKLFVQIGRACLTLLQHQLRFQLRFQLQFPFQSEFKYSISKQAAIASAIHAAAIT